MRVVIDTNLFVSAFCFGGRPRELVEVALSRRCTLVISDDILRELAHILSQKFAWSPEAIATLIHGIIRMSEVVQPRVAVTACSDPDDDRLLEAAVEGRADYIASGDSDLLRMGSFRGIEIVTAAQLLVRLA